MPWTTVSAPLRRMGHTSALATASAAAARSRSRAARPGGAPGTTRRSLKYATIHFRDLFVNYDATTRHVRGGYRD